MTFATYPKKISIQAEKFFIIGCIVIDPNLAIHCLVLADYFQSLSTWSVAHHLNYGSFISTWKENILR